MNLVIQISKFNGLRHDYEPYAAQQVTEDERNKILNYLKGKPKVEGFYRYHIPMPDGGRVIGYTINPDILGYVNANHTPR